MKPVRGPFVQLEAHPEHCESETELERYCHGIRKHNSASLLVADLFAGAGGLSLGLEQANFKVVIGADHDKEALETHRHHFGGMALDWDLGDADVVERLGLLVKDNKIDVLAGGPPCQPFSKAGRSAMRQLVREGRRDLHDRRRDLWRSFLEIAEIGEPRAVIMENVPDIALDREMFILRSMVFELERLGYTVQERVVDAWRYGVPQFRQRMLLVAIRDGAPFQWPSEETRKVTLANAISDLPPVEGGWRPEGGADGWAEYGGPRTAFQRSMRIAVPKRDCNKVFDHITRPVREDDEAAFELLDAESRYSDLPQHLKRYRDDIFDDKYKRLDGNDVSRTITAHIAKDGYWYIHPEQNRTLTVREAARIQTFPDDFRFAGPPSAAFRQIGNAVPPRLGFAVGVALAASLTSKSQFPPTSEETGAALAHWFRSGQRTSSPWFHATSVWHVLLGELALDRVTAVTASSLWPLLEKYIRPIDICSHVEEFTEVMSWADRRSRVDGILELAKVLGGNSNPCEQELERLVDRKLIPGSVAEIALLAAAESEEPVIASYGTLRVVSRFQANAMGRKNRNTDGRIATAKLIGYGPNARSAQLALLELATDVCLPTRPRCEQCPLGLWCKSKSEFAYVAPVDGPQRIRVRVARRVLGGDS